jgi:hypothetical protein
MIARLPEPYQQAIVLTELQGMSQVDAARQVGLSISGMKSRVQRGREQLKDIIRRTCRIELDIRGGVIECDPLRPSACSRDSMSMNNTNETKESESTTTQDASAGCCGGPAPKDANACCALDAEVKQSGGSGCGCAAKPQATPKKGCC